MMLHAEQVKESFMTSHQSVSREATYPAAMGYPRNQWYVAAFSREVQSGSPLRRVLLDTPVLLYRTEAGQDRKSVVSGKSVSVRVDLGGRGAIKKKKP